MSHAHAFKLAAYYTNCLHSQLLREGFKKENVKLGLLAEVRGWEGV